VGQYATVEDKLRELEAKKKEAASQSPSLELNFDKALRKLNKVLSSELQLPDEYLATGGAPANVQTGPRTLSQSRDETRPLKPSSAMGQSNRAARATPSALLIPRPYNTFRRPPKPAMDKYISGPFDINSNTKDDNDDNKKT
jgi:hypothetical protein